MKDKSMKVNGSINNSVINIGNNNAIVREENSAKSNQQKTISPKSRTIYSKEIIYEKYRRLGALRLQQARFGYHTPPHIINEIEDIEKEIKELQSES